MYRPMLFNADMARAILEGWKTETRRRVRAEQAAAVLSSPARAENPEIPDYKFIEALCDAPCVAGDILWVRETWTTVPDGSYVYKASVECADAWKGTWSPSIHMPKEAARVFLRVTEVRAERLQSISHEDAEQEGCWCDESGLAMPIDRFAGLWDSTVKPKDRPTYGWAANPWVWVICFERVDRPGDFLEGKT